MNYICDDCKKRFKFFSSFLILKNDYLYLACPHCKSIYVSRIKKTRVT